MMPPCLPLAQPGGGLVFLAIALGAGLAFAVWAWWMFFSSPERRALIRRNKAAAALRAELLSYGYDQMDARMESDRLMREHARQAADGRRIVHRVRLSDYDPRRTWD